MVEGGVISAVPMGSVFELIFLLVSILCCAWTVREQSGFNGSSYSVVDVMRRLLVAMA